MLRERALPILPGMGGAPHGEGRSARGKLDHDRFQRGAVVHPQTPQGRRAFESWDDPVAQPAGRAPEREESAARAMYAAFLVLVVIVALVLLL